MSQEDRDEASTAASEPRLTSDAATVVTAEEAPREDHESSRDDTSASDAASLPAVDVAPAPPLGAGDAVAPSMEPGAGDVVASSKEPAPADAPVPSGPYRTPPHEPPPPRPPPQGRPVLGPALSTFGVLLWSFVVAGQLTTSWLTGRPLANAYAIGIVTVATTIGWLASMARSRRASPAEGAPFAARALGVLAIAFVLFFATVGFAAFAGALASKNHDFGIGFALVVVGVAARIAGAKLAFVDPYGPTHRQRFATVALWVVSALVTLAAGVDLAANS